MTYLMRTKAHTGHEAVAAMLRYESPHWVLIKTQADRLRIGASAAQWNNVDRRPAAFKLGGYRFRTFKEMGPKGRPVFHLEGRYIDPSTSD